MPRRDEFWIDLWLLIEPKKDEYFVRKPRMGEKVLIRIYSVPGFFTENPGHNAYSARRMVLQIKFFKVPWQKG